MSKKRKPTETLKYQDLEIMQSQEVEHKTYKETVEELGVSVNAIADAKKKTAYRDLVIAALNSRGVTVETFAEDLKTMMKKKKTIVVAQEGVMEVDDNKSQLTALLKFGDILGVDAPKEFDLKRSMSTMGDDELQSAVDSSVKDLDGRVQNRLTGVPEPAASATNTVIAERPAMAEQSRKQETRPASS